MDLGDTSLQPIRLLGKGGFGAVYLCRCLDGRNNTNVCVKRIDINASPSDYNVIKGEIYILSQLKHPHIVNYLRSFKHAGFVNIVMEYAPNGTLRDVLRRRANRPAVSKSQLLRYFCDILMGLEYLHIRQVMHRDLKPENLLLGAQDQIKIADFGISVVGINSRAHWQGAGTPHYMAPEILNRSKFEYKSDIWSLGVVLYELCNGHTPFRQANSIHDLKYLIGKLTRRGLCQTILPNYGVTWANVCEEMLIYDVSSRISLPEIITMDSLITLTYYQKYFDYKY